MNETFKFRSMHGTRRGKTYELEDFRQRYDLDIDRARDLYVRFGPSALELDLLMAAKQRRDYGLQPSA